MKELVSKSTPAPLRVWQRMLSGRRLDLVAPDPADIAVGDIAHGLARLARWNGQTLGVHALSVAQHCVLVEQIAGALAPRLGPHEQLAALLHDAPEYVIGDLISPFKAAIGFDYKAFELRLQTAIHLAFGLEPQLPHALSAIIKQADRVAAYYEATVLAGFSFAEAELYFGRPPALDQQLAHELETLVAWPTAQAQGEFLARFSALQPHTE